MHTVRPGERGRFHHGCRSATIVSRDRLPIDLQSYSVVVQDGDLLAALEFSSAAEFNENSPSVAAHSGVRTYCRTAQIRIRNA